MKSRWQMREVYFKVPGEHVFEIKGFDQIKVNVDKDRIFELDRSTKIPIGVFAERLPSEHLYRNQLIFVIVGLTVALILAAL